VNPNAQGCQAQYACLGIDPTNLDPTQRTACTDQNVSTTCGTDMPGADCISAAGGMYCGWSFCAAQCQNNACTFITGTSYNWIAQQVSGTCYCIPNGQVGNGQAGDACPFGQVNASASACNSGLTCLGIPPQSDATCSQDTDCDPTTFLGHPDCVGGQCGTSFCSPQCGTGNTCQEGWTPYDISGTCYCLPGGGGQTGNAQMGDPCPFDTVNANADNCAEGLVCLGMAADTQYACSTANDCTTQGFPGNPDCVGGGCGTSFCSQSCTTEGQACAVSGYTCQSIGSGQLYCIPG